MYFFKIQYESLDNEDSLSFLLSFFFYMPYAKLDTLHSTEYLDKIILTKDPQNNGIMPPRRYSAHSMAPIWQRVPSSPNHTVQ
jgi:hypothetical protein